MSVSPPDTGHNFGLSIAVTKRIYATHAQYVGEELLQQLDDSKGGTGSSSGGGASAHVLVDWDGPPELQGYGVVVYFIMGPPEDNHKIFGRGRSTKNLTASETQANNAKAAKPLVRSVKIAPPTPSPYGTT